MKTVNLLFSAIQTSANLTPMELLTLFIDDIAKVSLENMELVRQYTRQTRPINPQQATVDASQAQDTTITWDNTTRKTAIPTAPFQPISPTVVRSKTTK